MYTTSETDRQARRQRYAHHSLPCTVPPPPSLLPPPPPPPSRPPLAAAAAPPPAPATSSGHGRNKTRSLKQQAEEAWREGEEEEQIEAREACAARSSRGMWCAKELPSLSLPCACLTWLAGRCRCRRWWRPVAAAGAGLGPARADLCGIVLSGRSTQAAPPHKPLPASRPLDSRLQPDLPPAPSRATPPHPHPHHTPPPTHPTHPTQPHTPQEGRDAFHAVEQPATLLAALLVKRSCRRRRGGDGGGGGGHCRVRPASGQHAGAAAAAPVGGVLQQGRLAHL